MTEQEKEILIERIITDPGSLMPSEIDAILHDEEMRDIYETSVAVADALAPCPEVDVHQEWERFSVRLHPRRLNNRRWIMRVAALIIGGVLAAAIMIHLSDSSIAPEPTKVLAKSQLPPKPQDLSSERALSQPEGTTAPPQCPARKPTLITQAEIPRDSEQEIDEYVRLEQARIDNELAMLNADALREEYLTQCYIDGLLDENDPEILDIIATLTNL